MATTPVQLPSHVDPFQSFMGQNQGRAGQAAQLPANSVYMASNTNVQIDIPAGMADSVDISVEARTAFETSKNGGTSLRSDVTINVTLTQLQQTAQEVKDPLPPAPEGPFDFKGVRDFLNEEVRNSLASFRETLRNAGYTNIAGLSDKMLTRVEDQLSEVLDDPLVGDYMMLLEQISGDPEAAKAFVEKVQHLLEKANGAEGTQAAENVPVPTGVSENPQMVGDPQQVANNNSSFHIEVDVGVEALATGEYANGPVSVEQNVNVNINVVQAGQKQVDPLVVDLDGDGVELTDAANGEQFDIDADGSPDQTAFVTGGDAFLAMDRNGNGTIDNGAELFGEHHGAVDGLAELTRFDDNEDGRINSQDGVWDQLLLMQAGQRLTSLEDAGIESIDLRREAPDTRNVNGNPITAANAYTRTDGTQSYVYDALLNVMG